MPTPLPPPAFGSPALPVDGFSPGAALHWRDGDHDCAALWRSERGAPPPKRVILANDTISADAAYQLACEGTAMLWQGDFHNARQLLQALARRVDQPAKRTQRKQVGKKRAVAQPALTGSAATLAAPVLGQAFHLHRQAQAQRARVLSMVLLPFNADYGVALRRAPDTRQACTQAWGPSDDTTPQSVASLRELLGLISAYEWRKNGVAFAALGEAPNNRIHPHYGVFSPVRGEYVDLVAQAPLPHSDRPLVAFDIGTGTGVLAAVLVRCGVAQVVATDQDPRALACARENMRQLDVEPKVQVLQADLYPPGQANLVVCNPPWLPARPGAPIEHAVYDEGSRMLRGFLDGLTAHLAPGGEGWLILSDLAEHLGLRTRAQLLELFAHAGLAVLGRLDAKPLHPKASDVSNALHAARAAEVTSLWRLAPAPSAPPVQG